MKRSWMLWIIAAAWLGMVGAAAAQDGTKEETAASVASACGGNPAACPHHRPVPGGDCPCKASGTAACPHHAAKQTDCPYAKANADKTCSCKAGGAADCPRAKSGDCPHAKDGACGCPMHAQAEQGKAGPAPAKQGLGSDGALRIAPEDRCPVCAMPAHEHAKFAAAIELTNGATYYFCATGCMIRAWLHPDRYLGHPKTDLKRAVVQDYMTGELTDAVQATWVAGSDVVGPMGPALVPLKNAADVETFEKRHGGKATFTLSEMDDAKWEAITGKKAVPETAP
ncbi:MAG: hypothetical protein C4523_07510 [Myxococcales bacterium]|nr:MAG: hypothetical protein C4523_07510 [Myxococcales bacterium]